MQFLGSKTKKREKLWKNKRHLAGTVRCLIKMGTELFAIDDPYLANFVLPSFFQKKNQELEFSDVDDSMDSSQNSKKERDTVDSDIEADVEDEVEEDGGEKDGGEKDGGEKDGREEKDGGDEDGGEKDGGEKEVGEEKEDVGGRKDDDQIEEDDHRRSSDQGDQHRIEGDKDPNNDQGKFLTYFSHFRILSGWSDIVLLSQVELKV